MECQESKKKFLMEYKIKTMTCDRGIEFRHIQIHTRVLDPQTLKYLPKGLHLGEHHSTHCFKVKKGISNKTNTAKLQLWVWLKHIHRTKSSPCIRFSRSEHLQFRESVPQNLAGGKHKEFIKVNRRRMNWCRIHETNHFGVNFFFMYLIPPNMPLYLRCHQWKDVSSQKNILRSLDDGPMHLPKAFNLPPCFLTLHWTHKYISSFHSIPIHILLTSWFSLKNIEKWTGVLSHMHLSIQRIKKISFHSKWECSHQKTLESHIYNAWHRLNIKKFENEARPSIWDI